LVKQNSKWSVIEAKSTPTLGLAPALNIFCKSGFLLGSRQHEIQYSYIEQQALGPQVSQEYRFVDAAEGGQHPPELRS